MKFFKKLKEKLFSTSSKLGGGLEELIDPKAKNLGKKNDENLVSKEIRPTGADARDSKSFVKNEKDSESNDKTLVRNKKKNTGFIKKIMSSVESISRRRRLDESMLEDLEDLLITSDIGVNTSALIVERIRKENFSKELSVEELKDLISVEIYNIMKTSGDLPKYNEGKLNIWLFVGVRYVNPIRLFIMVLTGQAKLQQ